MAEARFEFGQNWAEYSTTISEDRIRESEAGLRELLQRDDLNGLTLLDIGCGSGLHSLAALRLSATSVRALDYDPRSVETTAKLLAENWPQDNYSVEVGDILTLPQDATYDVVYSWGVLHHTGEMWKAIRRASQFTKPGGLFAIAIYRKTRLCGFWTWVKRNYAQRGPVFRGLVVGIYVFARVIRDLLKFKRPLARFKRQEARNHGMHWYYNVLDWVGGYPYESATPDEVVNFVEGLEFDTVKIFKARRLELGLFGSGNAEFLFKKREAQTTAADGG